jgi:hypothetical protein
MKPLFVSMKEGQRLIDWSKLLVFAVLVMIVAAVMVEGAWYLLWSHLSGEALVVSFVISALIMVRVVARAVAYQEEELAVEETVGSS